MFRSPRTRIALTADPGTSGSGCLSFVTEPAPITGTIPAAANCGANNFTASSLQPLNTSGVSIGVSRLETLVTSVATPGPEVLVATASVAGDPLFASAGA